MVKGRGHFQCFCFVFFSLYFAFMRRAHTETKRACDNCILLSNTPFRFIVHTIEETICISFRLSLTRSHENRMHRSETFGGAKHKSVSFFCGFDGVARRADGSTTFSPFHVGHNFEMIFYATITFVSLV